MVAGTLLFAPAVVRKTPAVQSATRIWTKLGSLTEIADIGVLVESHNRNSNDTQDHVEKDDWPTKVVLITKPTSSVHDNCGQCIGRGDEALRCADRESHVLCQNDWQEIGKCIRDGRSIEEDLT